MIYLDYTDGKPLKLLNFMSPNQTGSSSHLINSSSFHKIIMALQKAGLGNLVDQVETFTFELQRITLLWEELWTGCLIKHLDDLTKKVRFLQISKFLFVKFGFENSALFNFNVFYFHFVL